MEKLVENLPMSFISTELEKKFSELEKNHREMNILYKNKLEDASKDIWRCDPKNGHVEGKH